MTEVTGMIRILLAGGVGAALGSFANVCVYRIPRGESVAHPGSHCPGCGKGIRWFQNIPLLSFLMLRGRCAGCGRKISWQYPLVELLSAGLVAGACGADLPTVFSILLAVFFVQVLLIASVIDFHLKIIPDVLSLGLWAVGSAVAPLNPWLGADPSTRVWMSFGGAGLGLGFLWLLAWGGERFFKKEALGGGDVKLMAGVGALLGPWGILIPLFLASVLGTIFFFMMKIFRRLTWGAYLPFGPFLAIGSYLYFLFPAFWIRLFGMN